MALPAPIQLDLSTLRSDGTGQRPSDPSYNQITSQNPAYHHYIRKKLTDAFNNDAQLVRAHGHHEFIGDLPRGYTLWLHQTGYGNPIEELFGHPSGNKFRSAKRFSNHVGEMLLTKNEREVHIRADVRRDNECMARSAIQNHNIEGYYQARAHGIYGIALDINNLNHAHGLYLPRDANVEVLADQQNTAAIAITCTCVFR